MIIYHTKLLKYLQVVRGANKMFAALPCQFPCPLPMHNGIFCRFWRVCLILQPVCNICMHPFMWPCLTYRRTVGLPRIVMLRWLVRIRSSYLWLSEVSTALAGKLFAVLLIFDHLVTFDREVWLFWTGKLSGASILFFLNRYLNLVIYALCLVGPARMTDTVCCAPHSQFTAHHCLEVRTEFLARCPN